MAKTTYTTWLIRLQSWCIVQGARYPDYLNPFMPDQNRYKNIVMPFWFDYLGIKRVEVILYNDDTSRTASIDFNISINRSGTDIVLYTATIASGATTYVSTVTKTLQKNDRLFITITSAPNNSQSAMEVFFNYSNKETAGQFANNISVWFDQFVPKIPVGVIKEQVGDFDNTPMCSPSYGTNNSWLHTVIWNIALTSQRVDVNRNIRIMSVSTDRIADKIAIALNCWWSTGIWGTWLTTAPSANISAMINNLESWTNYLYIASRGTASNTTTTNDSFRLQKYSLNTSTQTLAFTARSSAYRTFKIWRSWGWIFSLRVWSASWSFGGKIITGTMLRQQSSTDSKIGWLLVFNNTLTLSNTFQRIGNTDASNFSIYGPWYIYEETSWWVTTAISCISHVTDTTTVVAPYPENIACLWKYDNTGAVTSQFNLSIATWWTAIFTNKWVTQYWTSAFVFGEFTPDPVGSPTTKRPYILEYDKDWNYIAEHLTFANESSEIMSVHVNSSYITFVLKNVSDWKSVVSRKNLSTGSVDFSKKIDWLNVYYAETISYNKVFLHGYSTVNSWSSYWYIYLPWVNGSQRQASNNFTISQQTISITPSYIIWYYWIAFIKTASTNPTYTQSLTTQTLSWWPWAWSSTNNVFYSLI